MKLRSRCALLSVLLLLGLPAWAGAPPSLTWRGDTTTASNVVEGIAHAWHRQGHPAMTLQPFNTVSGIDAVADGSADIGGSVRSRAPRRPNEADLVFTPVAWDALVIVANHRNPVDNLSLKQLHDIYYGRIHNWREVGGSDEAIHVYAVASPTDGIEFSLRRLLFGRGNQPVAAPRLYLSVAKLQRAVELDPQAMGVTTLSNARGARKLKMLRINHVAPSTTSVGDGSYPLYTPLYLVTAPESTAPTARQEQVQAFLSFAQGKAAAVALRRHGLIPYAEAASLADDDPERIAAIAKQTGRRIYTHANGPVAAPTSQRTAPARERMLAARAEHPASRWYTVVAGDTLESVARQHDVNIKQLRRWNRLKTDTLKAGQKLAVREP